MTLRAPAALLALLLLAACQLEEERAPRDAASDEAASGAFTTLGDDRLPTQAALDSARYVGRGRRQVGVDTAGLAAAARSNPETLEEIGTARDWSNRLHLPLGGDVAGPSVLKLQVLLDRAGFSPGEIDGRWGDNTELAVSWFQKSAGLPATGIVDEATVRALGQKAGRTDQLVVTRRLTAEDVEGEFVELPEDVYERAELDRQGFESLAEKLGETYHASPDLLARLNDGVDLDGLQAGDSLRVPNVMGAPRVNGDVSRVVISAAAGYLHALAADGRVLFHAPVTVGASYDPSPEGELQITSVTPDPWWHYQPAILESVPDDEPSARLPPGPNNAVGVVWMALSKEHYGIHGTSAPGTIGYASSAGCVRLTNWDARRLAEMVGPGTVVRFRDPAGQPGTRPGADSTRAASRRQSV